MSGRIDLTGHKASQPYTLHSQDDGKAKTPYHTEALRNLQTKSILSQAFFSNRNIQIVQNAIRYQVWIQSNKKHQISNQSETEVQIVMRSIYLQYARNSDVDIQLQINVLNKHVLDYCVDNVYVNLLQYVKYIDDITKEQTVIDRPQNVDVKGNKTLMPNYFV